MLATGLMTLTDNISDGNTAIDVPYPAMMQRALDRLTAMCLAAGADPPRSAMDLIGWAGLPFRQWPLQLHSDGIDVDERLLVGGRPSRECVEWAVLGSGDVEAEIRERRLMNAVLDKCRARNRADVYVAFRRLLVECPAMSERELLKQLGRPELTLLAHELRSAYRPAPPETLVGGFAEVCGGCGNLRTLDAHGRRGCREWDCPDPHSVRTQLTAAEGVVWLAREFRMFVTAPGRPEIRIAKAIERALKKERVKVHLWPGYDSCDLLPEGLAWPADVKSWANPVRLARRLTEKPFRPPEGSERAFIVIAQEQVRGREHYVRTVRQHCEWLKRSRHIEVVTERAYIQRVVARLREGKE
ncbi:MULTISPECIES: hypothetical protein [unclassified Nocardia]|uniref:pPIWI_RE_Y domain-containing protein n=1 Tax=unclassified Nocardia TaxID=2637762 RepID=UPI00278C3699|nr:MULTISPECIES: hypothetical protein [unclassified Nocardia]